MKLYFTDHVGLRVQERFPGTVPSESILRSRPATYLEVCRATKRATGESLSYERFQRRLYVIDETIDAVWVLSKHKGKGQRWSVVTVLRAHLDEVQLESV